MTERDHPPGRLQLPPWLPVYWAFRVGYVLGLGGLTVAMALLPSGTSWLVYGWMAVAMLFGCHWLFEGKRQYIVMWLAFHARDTDDVAVAWWETYESLWRERRKTDQ